jgi:hypothetical protein
VLQELALADDADTEKAALAALEQVASERRTAVARRAGEALAKLDHLRQQRAVEVFRRLGATFDPEHEERDLFFGAVSEVQIGATWRGEETDLRRLKWLRDVQQVTLSGSFVNDAWLDYLAGMQKLYAVKIKHANLTDAGLARLRDMSTLQYVKLLYVPIGDGAVRYLRECKQLARLKLYGTKISSEGARELVQSLGEKEVDCRRGAFLGISPSELGENWIVNSVTRDSSAEAAGIRAGDVITKYENQTVRDFETLTRLISNNNVGDTVTVEILRDGRTLVKQIKFGEWD